MCNKIFLVYFRILYFILINIKFEFPDSDLIFKVMSRTLCNHGMNEQITNKNKMKNVLSWKTVSNKDRNGYGLKDSITKKARGP